MTCRAQRLPFPDRHTMAGRLRCHFMKPSPGSASMLTMTMGSWRSATPGTSAKVCKNVCGARTRRDAGTSPQLSGVSNSIPLSYSDIVHKLYPCSLFGLEFMHGVTYMAYLACIVLPRDTALHLSQGNSIYDTFSPVVRPQTPRILSCFLWNLLNTNARLGSGSPSKTFMALRTREVRK